MQVQRPAPPLLLLIYSQWPRNGTDKNVSAQMDSMHVYAMDCHSFKKNTIPFTLNNISGHGGCLLDEMSQEHKYFSPCQSHSKSQYKMMSQVITTEQWSAKSGGRR